MCKVKVAFAALIFVSLPLSRGVAAGDPGEPAAKDFEEFQKALADVKSSIQAFPKQPDHSLSKYEKMADSVVHQWKHRSKVHFGWLMLVLAGPPSGWDIFVAEDPRHARGLELARKYALLALENADAMPVDEELKLTGFVTSMLACNFVPKGQQLADCRRKDAEVLFHAWKRLLDSVDQKFNPDDPPGSPSSVGADLGLPGGGMDPECVLEPLRSKYKAALAENRRKNEWFSEQWRIRGWIKMSKFPQTAEDRIIYLYSQRPYDVDELKHYLDRYVADGRTRARMIDAVSKNCDAQDKNAK